MPVPEAPTDPVGRALLDAVLASPDDDGPRLAYAAWLRDRGDAYGELIEVQCAVARLERDGDRAAAYRAARRGERQLFLDGFCEMFVPDDTFHADVPVRGFVERAWVSPERMRADRARWSSTPMRALALVEDWSSLETRFARADAAWALGQPELSRLEQFGVSRHVGPGVWLDAAAARAVYVHGPGDPDEPLSPLEVDAFPREAVLRIWKLGDRQVGRGALLQPLPALEELELRLDAPAPGLDALVAGVGFPALRTLCLTGFESGAAARCALVERLALPALRELDVRWPTPGIEGAVARSPVLRGLTRLDLSVPLSEPLAAALADTPLTALGVSGATPEALARLLAGRLPDQLTELRLSADADPGCMDVLARVATPRLRELSIRLDPPHAQVLARWPSLANVEALSLGPCDDAAVLALLDTLDPTQLLAGALAPETRAVIDQRWPGALL